MPREHSKASQIADSARTEWLELLRRGIPRAAAAAQVGIRLAALRSALACDGELERMALEAEAEADGKIAYALFEAAESGNVQACKLWLEGQRSGRWRR